MGVAGVANGEPGGEVVGEEVAMSEGDGVSCSGQLLGTEHVKCLGYRLCQPPRKFSRLAHKLTCSPNMFARWHTVGGKENHPQRGWKALNNFPESDRPRNALAMPLG